MTSRSFCLLPFCLLLLFALAAFACSSTDPNLLGPGGQPLEDWTPLEYRIAVAPFEIPSPLMVSGMLPETPTGETFQEDFIEGLREVNAASLIVAVDGENPVEASRGAAEILVLPRIQYADLRYDEVGERWYVTGLLWFMTWLGGLFVEDSVYHARMVVDLKIVALDTGRTIIDNLTINTDYVDLSFFDRNPVFSWGTLQSVIVPPFWTSDNKAQTQESLSKRALKIVAAKMKQFLVLNFPHPESLRNTRMETAELQ